MNLIDTLKWFRDNKHHYASWEPPMKYPDCTHMVVKGAYGVNVKIPADVMSNAKGLVRFDVNDHVFYPNTEGLKVIEQGEQQ